MVKVPVGAVVDDGRELHISGNHEAPVFAVPGSVTTNVGVTFAAVPTVIVCGADVLL